MRLRFGECVLDSDTRELFRGAEPAHLQPKAFRLLELLVENRPRALSKEEIHQKVWPRTFVSEATLASAISDIRTAIGAGGRDSQFIRTVHGFGYAFSGDAMGTSPQDAPTASSLIWEDREIPLRTGKNVLGRGNGVAVQVNHHSISRHHAQIMVQAAKATLEDLDSKNGTFLNSARLAEPKELEDGNEIRLGDVAMTFRRLCEEDSTRTTGRASRAKKRNQPG